MTHHIRKETDGRARVVKDRARSWSKANREAFLNHLAATCNVKQSCAAVGLHPVGLYRLRRNDPAFAEQWRAALLTGYDRLEGLLIARACAALGDVEHDEVDAATLPKLTVEDAMRLLTAHATRMRPGAVHRGRPPLRRASPEETNAAILKHLAALDRRGALDVARAATAAPAGADGAQERAVA